jgi:hypothetical protein
MKRHRKKYGPSIPSLGTSFDIREADYYWNEDADLLSPEEVAALRARLTRATQQMTRDDAARLERVAAEIERDRKLQAAHDARVKELQALTKLIEAYLPGPKKDKHLAAKFVALRSLGMRKTQ